jgi:hypothetical protein
MSTTYAEGNKDLINVNVALGYGVTLMAPLLPQIDLVLFGTFGLGPMAIDFQARLDAALSITVVRPDVWVTGQLKAMADLMAGISAGVVLPGIAANVNVGVAADLSAKLFGINAVIDATLALKLPAVAAVGEMTAAMNAQVGYLAWSGTTTEFDSEAVGKLKTLAAGNGGGTGDVYVIALMFGSAATFNAAASMFLTS